MGAGANKPKCRAIFMARKIDWLKGQLSKEHKMLHSWVGISVLPLPDVGQAAPLHSFSIYLTTFARISYSLSVLVLSTKYFVISPIYTEF